MGTPRLCRSKARADRGPLLDGKEPGEPLAPVMQPPSPETSEFTCAKRRRAFSLVAPAKVKPQFASQCHCVTMAMPQGMSSILGSALQAGPFAGNLGVREP
jgi:hypothetical protein